MGVQSNCSDNTRINWQFLVFKGGNVTEYVLERAPIELETLFNSIYGRYHSHIVLRKPLVPCLYSPCLNGGTCNETFDGFHCTCQDGYEGMRCETSLYIESISLQGSNRTSEGLVGFTTRGSEQLKFFTNESWSMNTSHQVCQELGYRRGASATVSGNVYDPVDLSSSSEYGALRCAKTTTNLTDCKYESRGFNGISQDMIIAVVCCRLDTCGPEGKPLGMASGVIPNSAITISSCQASRDCEPAGRLDTPYPWVPDESDYANPWIQVSLHSLYIITGVSTDGHDQINHFVSSYTLSYSLDNNAWLPYRDVYTTSESNISKVFPGNFRINYPVEHSLYPLLMARFIRLHPRTYIGSPSFRFELLGFGPLAEYIGDIYEPNFRCVPLLGKPLGVQNRSIIPDAAFSAFSRRSADFRPEYARLYGTRGWVPQSESNPGWWKVDLGIIYYVTGIITQGRSPSNPPQWITSYTLRLSLDDVNWTDVQEEEVFSANYDTNTPVTNLLRSPIPARFVQLNPIGYHEFPSLRCEVLGVVET